MGCAVRMETSLPCISSGRSAFAVVTANTTVPMQPAPATLRAVSNAHAAPGRAPVPTLLRLAPGETGNDLVARLRQRCAEFSAPMLIDAALAFVGTLGHEETGVFLRATTLALADDRRLATSLAAQRQQVNAPSPHALAAPLPPLLQEYVDALAGLLRAVADNGAVMSGTYGFATYVPFCLDRIRMAPCCHVAETALNDALHWQRGARQAIGGVDTQMWPVRGQDPLGPVGFAFALHEATHDAVAVLAELRGFHPWPAHGARDAAPGKVSESGLPRVGL